MNEIFIKDAAKLYYNENIEGEPLTQDTPIECFIAGAKFIVHTMKIHQNNCNIQDKLSYNQKKYKMNNISKTNKILMNIEKIIKISGFYIMAPGDESVGIFPSTWELKNDFYFDTQEELKEFKIELKSLFEFYCGEIANVLTFEEYQAQCDDETK